MRFPAWLMCPQGGQFPSNRRVKLIKICNYIVFSYVTITQNGGKWCVIWVGLGCLFQNVVEKREKYLYVRFFYFDILKPFVKSEFETTKVLYKQFWNSSFE